jgi:hypothetical protein
MYLNFLIEKEKIIVWVKVVPQIFPVSGQVTLTRMLFLDVT